MSSALRKLKDKQKYNFLVPDELQTVLKFWSWLTYMKDVRKDDTYKSYIVFWNQCIELLFQSDVSLDCVPSVVSKGQQGDMWITAFNKVTEQIVDYELLRDMRVDQAFMMRKMYNGKIRIEIVDDDYFKNGDE